MFGLNPHGTLQRLPVYNDAVRRALDVQLLQTLTPTPNNFHVSCIRFSPDNRVLAAGCPGGIEIFDIENRNYFCYLKHDSERGAYRLDEMRPIRFFPDGKTLAAVGGHNMNDIHFWDMDSHLVKFTFVGHEAPILSLDLSEDAKLLVSGSVDGTARLWDVASRQQTKVISLGQAINTVALSPDGNFLAVGNGNDVQILDYLSGDLVETLGGADGHENLVFSTSFSPNGRQIASCSFDKTIKVWHVGVKGDASREYQNQCIHTLEGHRDLVISLCWTPDGRFILSGSKDRQVQVWDAETGNAQMLLPAHANTILSICASPDGRLFATGGADKAVRIWSYARTEAVTAADLQSTEVRHGEVSAEADSPKLPGFGLPLNFLPPSQKRFPVLIGDQETDWTAATLLIREVCMLKMIEDLTNKPEWWRKVRDSDIVAKWKTEAMGMDWTAYRRYGDFTPAMADACIDELQKKADLCEKTGLIPVFDYSACVIKSDSISQSLFDTLKAAVAPLEDVPEARKDWHPGSDGKVLDLVHPSLWPLLYGRTRILSKGRIDIQSCLGDCGRGQVLPRPDPSQQILKQGWVSQDVSIPSLSLDFQWLPCDVLVSSDGHTKIESYINNLHPVEHEGLYGIINAFLEKSLPAWDIIYRWPKEFRTQRLQAKRAGVICTTKEICEKSWECNPWNRPLTSDEPDREEDEHDQDGYETTARGKLDTEWFDATHAMDVPDAVPESSQKVRNDGSSRYFRLWPEDVKTSGFFNGTSRIQVIVKLANILLTPEQPSYDGGSWHIEGQLNEHICATALFYYDNDNITESRLSFRAQSNTEDLCTGLNYRQCDYRSISRTFAIDAEPNKDSTLQEVGSSLTRQGRALFFPNLFQHQVQPFSLADTSRPGHRKILALFLVDPAIPIISTANVPPQQPHWKVSRADQVGTAASDDEDVIDEAEAKRIRRQLMDERSTLQSQTTKKLEGAYFNFCEH